MLGAGAATTAVGTNAAAATAADTDWPDQGRSEAASNANHIDPVFGRPSAGPNPCAGDADEGCFEEFPAPVRPDHEVELHVDLPGPLLALAEAGGVSELTTGSINEEVADGAVTERNLHRPDVPVSFETPEGETSLTVAEIARALAGTHGFYFEPAGLHVRPGDVVLFSAETPDHAVAAYHERHGRQNRVPDGAPPVSSPLIPVGGSWLYRFDREGVYDLYCPPHQLFGMVMRVVVNGGGEVPAPSIERTGRPPGEENAIPSILAGLDPNLPSSAEALATGALEPEDVVEDGAVSWESVVAEHRG